MNKSIRNEQTKLFAALCNTVAAALLTTGVLGPIITVFYGFDGGHLSADAIVAGTLICTLISGSLHLAARLILTEIIE